MSGTLLDHCLTDLTRYKYNVSLIQHHFSDHRILFVNIDLKIKETRSQQIFRVTDYSAIRNNNNLTNLENVNSYQTLIELCRNVIEMNTKVIKAKASKNEWVTVDLKLMIKFRDKFYKLSKKFPNNMYFQSQFQYYRNLATKLFNKNKKEYFSNIISVNISNSKKLWREINEIVFNKGAKQEQYSLRVNGNLVTDEENLANVFNKHFIECGNVQINVSRTTNVDGVGNEGGFDTEEYLTLTNSNEINNIVEELNVSAANGFDQISAKFIKINKEKLTHVMVRLINYCIENCEFPDILKVARVKALHKAGPKTEVNNYRPIAILSAFAKIFEMVLFNKLKNFLNIMNFINKSQFGFVAQSNTLAACTQLVEKLYEATEQGMQIGIMFIDFRKAFDLVNHHILIEKLIKARIGKNFTKIIKEYLKNRTQFVGIGNARSESLVSEIGVPQGSKLGPLLFIIFINDLFASTLSGELQMYADDAVLVYKSKSLDEIKTLMTADVVTINAWCLQNAMALNVEKTKYIIIDSKKMEYVNNFQDFRVIFEGKQIERVEEFKFLGLTIDNKLSWINHIDSIKKKILPTLFAIYRIRRYVNKKVLWSIYHAHFLSHVKYLSPIWSAAPAYKINELQRMQNKIIKAINFLNYYHPSHLLYTETLNISKTIMYELIIYFYKIKQNLIKCNIPLQRITEIHDYNTRQRSNFFHRNIRTNKGINGILYRGVVNYNDLPHSIKEIITISQFKKELLKHVSNQI